MVEGDDESSPPINDSTVFSCSPKLLTSNDTLVFTLRVPHGGYLTVESPDGMEYNLVSVRADSLGRWRSIVPSDAFKTMAVLKVPASIMWPPYYFGRDTIPERVFRLAGEYEVMMGDNLNTDYGPPPFICNFSFKP
jgi:hypothetical protein